MERSKIQKLADELSNYVISSTNRIQPYMTIYGENKKTGEKVAKSLTLGKDKSMDELTRILNSYLDNLKKYIRKEISVKEFANDGADHRFLYKIIDESDWDVTNQLFNLFKKKDGSTHLSELLNKKKYINVYFIVELNLDQSGNKKILLFKSISQNYVGKKNRFYVSLFSEKLQLKFIDNKRDLVLDDNFEIAALIDTSEKDEKPISFFFIQKRDKFEDLYGYTEKYRQSFNEVRKKLNFIDWDTVKQTDKVEKNCYSVSIFDKLDECMDILITDLKSNESNEIKEVFSSKKINYEIDKNKLRIYPSGNRDLNVVLKMLRDELATTYMLKRKVLGSDFEELN